MSDAALRAGLRWLECDPGALDDELAGRLLSLVHAKLGTPGVVGELLKGRSEETIAEVAELACCALSGGRWALAPGSRIEVDEGPYVVSLAEGERIDEMETTFVVLRRPHVCDPDELKTKARRNMGMPPPLGGIKCDHCDAFDEAAEEQAAMIAQSRARLASRQALRDHQAAAYVSLEGRGEIPGPYRGVRPDFRQPVFAGPNARRRLPRRADRIRRRAVGCRGQRDDQARGAWPWRIPAQLQPGPAWAGSNPNPRGKRR